MLGLIITGAVLGAGYFYTRRFVRERLRFVDAVRRPAAPLVAGAATALLAAPVRAADRRRRHGHRRRRGSRGGVAPAGAITPWNDRRSPPRAAPAILLVGLAGIAAAPVAAQTRWEQQVQQQRASSRPISPCSRFAGSPFTGQLGAGERETLRIALREGTQYALVALCDEDCRDLEVTVLGEDDAVLAKSAGWSDRPLLEVQAPATGKYRVIVTMAHCGSGPCAYGVGVFMK
jgi:hypothetical protein